MGDALLPSGTKFGSNQISHIKVIRDVPFKKKKHPASTHDGKTPNWYHDVCFFSWQCPKTVDDIAHFQSLRWDDQEKIRAKVGTGTSGKKRDADAAAAKKVTHYTDFMIVYSKSNQAVCRGCGQKIIKGEIQVSKKDYESNVGQDMWHHLTCFTKLRSELGYYESADKLFGLVTLKKEDQQEVKKQLPAIKQEEVPVKKAKTEDNNNNNNNHYFPLPVLPGSSQEGEMKTQNILMYNYRDQLKDLKKKELQLLLETNDQQIPTGKDSMLDRLSDIMMFGALEPCNECNHGQFVFDMLGYMCQGNLTEWAGCDVITKEPKRRPFFVPAELSEKYLFLKEYKYVPRTRIIRDVNPTVAGLLVKKEDENGTGLKVQRVHPVLYKMEFVIVGNVNGNKDAIQKQIISLGGEVTTMIKKTVMAVISTPADVEKMDSLIQEAQNADIQVVPEDFLKEAKEYSGRIPELVTKKSICTWGSDPHTRLPPELSSSSNFQSTSRSMFTSLMPSRVKLQLKGGSAVDPVSGLEDHAHVYQSGEDKYTVVLGLTDIQKQKNSFYKLQLLQADSGNQFWVFRSWGRIGTTIGGNKTEEMSLHEAKWEFCRLYEEKTGNNWDDRHNFVKVPGCYYPIDIDYSEAEMKINVDSDIPSKLKKPVQELVQLIFDVNNMKKLMLEFELDTEKMPLGKLSKAQLQSAYGVLTELQYLVESNDPLALLIDASNRFYTFVPHSFGVDDPPVIDNLETIKKKIEMVENLKEIEIAYNLMKSTSPNKTIDYQYDQLKTEIDILDFESEEFSVIKEYVKNTHAATHSNYELEIKDVFTIKRQGEEERYKPFCKLHNRKLLWHGSRSTNFAGILSKGLRIAPPEAPASGYMFGKGIYFADMVSKSANYCFANRSNNIGLLLLCEVALGEMHELNRSKYIKQLPMGKHSVKGVGKTEPDPQAVAKIHGDVLVPIGKGVTNNTNRRRASNLLYNEYIVYDAAQVNIKYLIKMDFKYKSRML